MSRTAACRPFDWILAAVAGLGCWLTVAPVPALAIQISPAPGVANPGSGIFPRVLHEVQAEFPLGSLQGRGTLPVRVTVKRTGQLAVPQRDVAYFIYDRNQHYYAGRSDDLQVFSMTVPRGSVSAAGEFNLRVHNGSGRSWNRALRVETDGDFRNSGGEHDLAVLPLNNILETVESQVQCLFVGSEALVDRQKIDGDSPQWISASLPPVPAVDGVPADSGSLVRNPPPTAWFLYEVLGQVNQQNRNAWSPNTVAGNQLDPPGRLDAAAHLATVRALQFLDIRALSDLPETWQGLLPVDYLFLSAGDLSLLQASRPQAFAALRQWVIAGGRLVLVDCGGDFGELSRMEELWFQAGPGDFRGRWKTAELNSMVQSLERSGVLGQMETLDPASPGFLTIQQSGARHSEFTAARETAFNPAGHRFSSVSMVAPRVPHEFAELKDSRSPPAGEAVIADFGGGRILAMPSPPSVWGPVEWKTVLLAGVLGAKGPLLTDSVEMASQYSFAPVEMPGLALPPWVLFLVLIVVFAASIGPVAYFWLNRLGKLPWILGLAPLVSGGLTLGLLLFAILSEGLGTRIVRLSQTRLDVRNGVGFTTTHFTVYSGIAPGACGFPGSQQVYPELRGRYNSLTRHTPQATVISGGNLRARTIHQLAVSEPVQQAGSLIVTPPRGDGEDWTITNELGTHLSPVVVHCGEGRWLFLDQLRAGESLGVRPLDAAGILAEFQRVRSRPGSRLADLAALFADRQSRNRFASVGYDQWGNPRPANFVPALGIGSPLDSPGELLETVLPGDWLVMSESWEPAGRLRPGDRYLQEYHLIHGRWK